MLKVTEGQGIGMVLFLIGFLVGAAITFLISCCIFAPLVEDDPGKDAE